MATETQHFEDEYLKAVIAAKSSEAVIKVDFATFASTVPDHFKIFAYEGVDDKTVYYQWINRLRADLQYEPYECKNKINALRLFDLLERDLTGLGDRVYYFVDKDFDGLQGRPENAKIYLTCKYSIENYMVSAQVLEDLLKIEFHCNGYTDLRKEVIEKFEELYTQFLNVTEAINFRIFIARKLKIRQTVDLPTRINLLANVDLNEVLKIEALPNDIVKLEREPTEEEINSLLSEFSELESKNDYRGKFAFLFFAKWLSLLREDRLTEHTEVFSKIPKTEVKIKGDFTIATLAPKTAPPEHLHKFLSTIS
jgi:hypothetical protein